MKKLFVAAMLCVILTACSVDVPMIESYSGVWSAYVIRSSIGDFRTSIGVRGVNIPVNIAYVYGAWHIVEGSEIGMEVFPVTL